MSQRYEVGVRSGNRSYPKPDIAKSYIGKKVTGHIESFNGKIGFIRPEATFGITQDVFFRTCELSSVEGFRKGTHVRFVLKLSER